MPDTSLTSLGHDTNPNPNPNPASTCLLRYPTTDLLYLYAQTANITGLDKTVKQISVGKRTDRFLPPDKFYTWLLSLLNTWAQGLVQPPVPVDGPGYAWHLSHILLSFALLLVYFTVWVGSFHVGSFLGLRSCTQTYFLFSSIVHTSHRHVPVWCL